MKDQQLELESRVICEFIVYPSETKQKLNEVSPNWFHYLPCQDIFKTIQSVLKNDNTDVVAVLNELLPKNQENLKKMIASQPVLSLEHLDTYIDLLRENWRKRTMKTQLDTLSMEFEELSALKVTEQFHKILAEQMEIEKSLKCETQKSFVDSVSEWYQNLFKKNTSIKTGFSNIDFVTGGLQRGACYVISARTGDGKTDFALNIAIKMCKECNVTYFSMEMSRDQLMNRVFAKATHINSIKFRDKTLEQCEIERVAYASDFLTKNANFIIDEKTRITLPYIESIICKNKPDVIFVDHIRLMCMDRKKSECDNLTNITQTLKEIAKKYNIVVIEISQTNREGGKNTKADTSQLKGSGSIEEDADGIFQIKVEKTIDFLSDDQYYSPKVHVTKNRYGGTGELEFHWQPQYSNWVGKELKR